METPVPELGPQLLPEAPCQLVGTPDQWERTGMIIES